MTSNVNFQTDQRAWPPDGLVVETEQQIGGAQRQVVKIGSVTAINVHTGNQELRVFSAGHVCLENSSSTPLGISATFTGAWQDTLDYSEVITTIYTDQNSATDGLKILWSADGLTADPDPDVFTISAGVSKTFSFPCNRRYLKVIYTNSAAAQTIMLLSTELKRFASKGSSHRLADTLSQQDDAIVTKSLIAGKTTAAGGAIVDVKVNPSGALTVDASVSSSTLPTGAATSANQSTEITALGSLLTELQLKADLTETQQVKIYDPVIGRYNRLNPGNSALIADGTTRLVGAMFGQAADANFWTTAANGTSAAATLSNGIYTLASGTANNGYASIVSVRHGRFLFVNPNLFRAGFRLPDITEAGNTRIIGAVDITAGNPPTINNGYYISFDEAGGLTLACKRAGAAAVTVSSGAFNGSVAAWTADTNAHALEIMYFVMGVWFFIDGVFIHKFAPTTLPLNNDLDVHCFALSQNGAGGSESADLEIWAMSILRLGKELTRPQYRNMNTNTTVVCKIGTGSLHGITVNKKPTSAGIVTLYDSTGAATNPIASIDINNAVGNQFTFAPFGLDFQFGLVVITTASAGNPDVTVVFD